MAHLTLNQYLQQIDNAWRSRDGISLADFVSFRHAHVASSKLQMENPESSVERVLEPPMDEIVAAHLRCVWYVNNQDFVQAYYCQQLLVQAFVKIFQMQREQNWALPVMYAICIDLRLLAQQADKLLVQRGSGRPLETLEKAADILMSCFRVCAADNRSAEETTKRWGMLALVNQLFKVYFRINKLHLCKPLIRAIESSPYKDQFSLSQQITYKYYVGRKHMFASDYKAADMYLTFAFERCHKKSVRNKRLILIYLIPVKMLLVSIQRKLQVAQNACIRFIFDLDKYDHISTFYAQSKILTVDKRRTLHCLLLLYKILNSTHHTTLSQRFQAMKLHRARESRLLCIPHHNTTIFSKSFTVTAIRAWNNLPSTIKCNSTFQKFKKEVSTWFKKNDT